MKKLIILAFAVMFYGIALGQVLAPKGIRVGKSSSHTVGVIDSIATYGNKAKFYRGSNLLVPYNPDTISLGSVAVLKADTVYQKPGAYTTRYDFKNEPTNEFLYRAYKGFGSTIKLYPLCNPIFSGQLQMTDARTMLVLAYTPDSVVITGFKFSLYTAGAYTGDQYNGIGLYSFSNGVITKISETANDANLWTATANTVATKALPAPVTIAPGYYYIAFLYNNSAQTTAPLIYANWIGPLVNIGQGWTNNSSIAIGCQINTQTTLVTPITMLGTITATQNYISGIIAY